MVDTIIQDLQEVLRANMENVRIKWVHPNDLDHRIDQIKVVASPAGYLPGMFVDNRVYELSYPKVGTEVIQRAYIVFTRYYPSEHGEPYPPENQEIINAIMAKE